MDFDHPNVTTRRGSTSDNISLASLEPLDDSYFTDIMDLDDNYEGNPDEFFDLVDEIFGEESEQENYQPSIPLGFQPNFQQQPIGQGKGKPWASE